MISARPVDSRCTEGGRADGKSTSADLEINILRGLRRLAGEVFVDRREKVMYNIDYVILP